MKCSKDLLNVEYRANSQMLLDKFITKVIKKERCTKIYSILNYFTFKFFFYCIKKQKKQKCNYILGPDKENPVLWWNLDQWLLRPRRDSVGVARKACADWWAGMNVNFTPKET